jgi:hypothetical protein
MPRDSRYTIRSKIEEMKEDYNKLSIEQKRSLLDNLIKEEVWDGFVRPNAVLNADSPSLEERLWKSISDFSADLTYAYPTITQLLVPPPR